MGKEGVLRAQHRVDVAIDDAEPDFALLGAFQDVFAHDVLASFHAVDRIGSLSLG